MSFSIRDEERRKVILRIGKPHSPIEVLRTLFGKDLPLNRVWSIQCSPECNTNYHGYVGLSDKKATQWIFLNHKPIYCPLILRLIKIAFKERLNLSSDQEKLIVRDSYVENMFILFFLTVSQKEFTFVTENGKRYIMFYDMQKILNTIKNCTFKCFAEETTISAVTPYLCKTQLLRRIYLKSEKSIFNNDINGCKNITSSVIKNKIVTIGFKRRKITSTVITKYLDKQHKRDDNIEIPNYYIDKKDNILNSIQCQIDVASIKHTNLCENKAIKKRHNGVDKTQGSFMNFDITDNYTKSDEVYNYCDDNNNTFVNMISPLSEWSNWTYYTNNKKHEPARDSYNTFSENDIRSRQFFECNNQFDFLPRKLYDLLQYRHVKLTNVKDFNSPNDIIPRK